jgi:acetyltransferase-like isoleucine patch superfamily enzyme
MQLLVRILYKLLSLPTRAREAIYCRRLTMFCVVGDNVRFTPEAKIYNQFKPDAIHVGAHSLCMGEFLVGDPEATIRIGEWFYMGPQSKVWALDRITIGSRVFISHGVQIFDNNSHSISASDRHGRFRELTEQGRHLSREAVARKAVAIEDDVWIGFNAAIMKGVTVGRGAIVGACAVVTHDVPAYAIVVGNPARQVGDSRP